MADMPMVNRIGSTLSLGYSALSRNLSWGYIPIFTTDRCNSQCKICNIWKKTPKTDLNPSIIQKILTDKAVSSRLSFLLTGGEFILHPKHEEILSLFNDYKARYILLSNALLPEKLVKTVRKFKVKRLSLSLDGTRLTYEKTRGVDGYLRVEEVVKELKDETEINIGYTVSEFNDRKDLLDVMCFCKRYNVNLSVGYYCSIDYYNLPREKNPLYRIDDLINSSYHKLYPLWATGNYKIPCFSIFLRPVIRPNGDVELCEPRQVKLGNLNERGLGEIWHSKETLAIQKAYHHCNACWHDSQRLTDISALSTMKHLVPAPFLNHSFGKIQWKKTCALLD